MVDMHTWRLFSIESSIVSPKRKCLDVWSPTCAPTSFLVGAPHGESHFESTFTSWSKLFRICLRLQSRLATPASRIQIPARRLVTYRSHHITDGPGSTPLWTLSRRTNAASVSRAPAACPSFRPTTASTSSSSSSHTLHLRIRAQKCLCLHDDMA